MKAKYSLTTFIFIMLLLQSCGSYEEFQNSATKEYGQEQMQKFAKYMIQGKSLYTTHCSNCHQADGTGLGKVYPPLKKADFLLVNQQRTYCLVKNGIAGEIIVNGVVYNQIMPANKQLTDLEIAEISTYIYNSWGNETGMISINEVSSALKDCKD